MANFQVLEISIDLIAQLRPIVERIQRHDRDLASQLRRSASSVPLNHSEGERRVGKDRLHHYRIAAGSAAEARTTLSVARNWGYLDGAEPALQLLDRVQAMLWRLTR